MFKLVKVHYQRDAKKILFTSFIIFFLLYLFFYSSSITTITKVEGKEVGKFKNYITITSGKGEREKISVPESTYSLVETNQTYFITYYHNFIRGNYIKNLKITEPLRK
ncbi:hypothetical protein J45TS6_35520 [Paenibacillus sp. J45TS6]|uniref:hypothetical protein n=1 Tax=unclassified Paenibacillus TaxID=185978 RepID=UPI001B168640|nr:hypothetical protein [Paenibacillus sp. J45TS6]GIP45093.1 hypothetical protein J45TS6_35520 [Paenibacillus sp. J45TS6]